MYVWKQALSGLDVVCPKNGHNNSTQSHTVIKIDTKLCVLRTAFQLSDIPVVHMQTMRGAGIYTLGGGGGGGGILYMY